MTTLAEYNNNPGNIKPAKGVKYEGLIGVDEKGFGVFETLEQGQKALMGDLKYKLEKRGIKTPAEFVDIYDPATENDSEETKQGRDNYKIYIAQRLGLKSTTDPFPENAVDTLAKAVTAFEGGKWMEPEKEEKTDKQEPAAQGTSEPEEQYSGDVVATIPTEEEDRRSAKEMGAAGALLGGSAGSVYTAKAPVLRLAQRVGLLPGGKPITPQDAAALVEKTMSGTPPESVVRKPHGGENWQKSLTGISTPGAQMDKSSLDLAKRMQGTVGIGGAPGFTGGTITEGGIILSPQDAAAVNAKQQARAQQILANEARIQQLVQKANRPDYVQRAARAVVGSAPVRGSLAGLGVGYNLQDAYNKFDEGDTLGGSLATGAATASGLSVVPKMARVMGPAAVGLTTASQIAGDLRRGDKQAAAESGLTGLTALFPRVFGPAAAGVYSRGLNEGEEKELERRRKMAPTISP